MNYYYHPNMQPQKGQEGGQPVNGQPQGAPMGYAPAPQGMPVPPQGYAPAPQGAPMPPQGYVPAPQGAPMPPQGYVPAPQRAPMPPQGYAPAPQGVPVPPQGYVPAPQGAPMSPQGYAPAPQGAPMPPQGYAPAPQRAPMPPQGYAPAPQGVPMPPQYGQPPVNYGQPPYGMPVQQGYMVPPQPMLSPEEIARMEEENARKEAERKEHKAIRRHGNGLGVGMLLVQAIGSVVALLIPFIANLIAPGITENGGVFYDAIEYAIYSPVAILLAMWIGLKIIKKPFGELVPFGRVKPLLWSCLILFSFAFIFVGNIAGDLAAYFSPNTVENLESAMGNEPTTTAELIVNILHVAAIPALVEELAFRGIAMGVLRPYGDRFAVIMSSVLFGLLHGNIVQIPFAFCVGLILAYTVIRTNNIIPAMIIHFINNAMSCLLSYFFCQSSFTGEEQTMIMYGVYGAWLVLGLIGFFLLRFGFRQKLRACYKPYEGCLATGARNKAFIFSVPIIACVAVYGMSVIMMLMNVSDMISSLGL